MYNKFNCTYVYIPMLGFHNNLVRIGHTAYHHILAYTDTAHQMLHRCSTGRSQVGNNCKLKS